MNIDQQAVVCAFIKENFDARVALAEKDATFNGLSDTDKNRRVKAWAQMYGKMAYGLLEPRPVFSTGIRDVMRLFKCSQYYDKYTMKEVSDCCNASWKVDGYNEEGTHYYVCDKCRNA